MLPVTMCLSLLVCPSPRAAMRTTRKDLCHAPGQPGSDRVAGRPARGRHGRRERSGPVLVQSSGSFDILHRGYSECQEQGFNLGAGWRPRMGHPEHHVPARYPSGRGRATGASGPPLADHAAGTRTFRAGCAYPPPYWPPVPSAGSIPMGLSSTREPTTTRQHSFAAGRKRSASPAAYESAQLFNSRLTLASILAPSSSHSTSCFPDSSSQARMPLRTFSSTR